MLALTAAIAVGVWHYQSGQEQQTRQEWAQRGARELDDQVSQTGAALLGVRGLFAASNMVEQNEFMRFAGIQLGRSTLLGLSWTPRVPAAARGRFERSTGLRIIDRAPTGATARRGPGPSTSRCATSPRSRPRAPGPWVSTASRPWSDRPPSGSPVTAASWR